MNKRIRIGISIFWLLLTYIPFFLICFSLKYPTFDKLRYGYIVMPILLGLPIISLIYSVLSDRVFNSNKVFDTTVIVLVILYLIYTFIFTFGFRSALTVLYPMASSTENADNYLKIDDRLAESDQKYIDAFFPTKIPNEATNVKYYYYCNAYGSYFILAYWTLPESEYYSKKERVIEDKKSYYKDGEIFKYNDFDDDMFTADVEFMDSKFQVCYSFECNSLF